MRRLWTVTFTVIVLLLWRAVRADSEQCPDSTVNPSCHCHKLEKDLQLDCPAATAQTLRMILEVINTPIQSLTVHEPDKAMTKLPKNIFPDSIVIRSIDISRSNIEEIHDESLRPLAPHLESFSLRESQLKEIPQKAFKGLNRLIALDLENNQIAEIPSYTFYGLRLMKLSLKGNRLQSATDYSLAGLDATLSDLDISENKLRTFPINAVRRLEQLRHLRLSHNEISFISVDTYSHLNSLVYLDLSNNVFETINSESFKVCLAVRTLLLYCNAIEVVHEGTFSLLLDLETLDLSRNKIIFLHSGTFRQNQKVSWIDLSRNHLHYVGGVFGFLPNLQQVFLWGNNVLEVLSDAFTNSSALSVVYLQDNAIGRLDEDAFLHLTNLTQLHLGSNFIANLPRRIFERNYNLSLLSLDGNWLIDLEPGLFEKTLLLREIRLQNNKLQTIHKGVFDPLPELRELQLQHNEIASIDDGAFRTLQSLQHINLQGNAIGEVGDVFRHATALVSLQLDNNALKSLDNHTLEGQSSVKILWLGHNRLQKVEPGLFRDLVQVEKVYLNNNSISLVGDGAFKTMRSLKFLYLNTNHVKQISSETFAELHELEELDLSHNLIERMEGRALINLKKLRVLDLSFNPLKVLHDSIFQEGLPIRTLSLVNCSISKIESNAFRGLNNLNDLNLARNKLSVGDLRHLDIPGLRDLQLSHNQLSDLDEEALNGLPSLQEIALENCLIARLPHLVFAKNKNLMRIDLTANFLAGLHPGIFSQLNILKELKLNFNNLTQIPYQALSNISTMEALALSHNNFVTLEVYQLNGMPNLRHLDLSHNFISGLTGFSSTTLNQLLSVDLSGNKLSTLPTNFFHHSHLLRQVDLSQNRFHHIPNAALSEITLPGMGWLNISANPIVNMHKIIGSVRSYPALEEMHLEHSDLIVITSKEFELFPSLLHVHLGYNKILKISPGAFSSLHQLISLDLGVNQIEIIPQERLFGLNSLRILNVTHNRLKDLDEFPEDLKSLKVLDVAHNQIARIRSTTFNYLVNLAELYLYGNWVSFIAPEAFRALQVMAILDFSRNYLEKIPVEALKHLETQIRSLKVEDNPLICNCDSEELWEWLKDHRKLMKQPENHLMKCHSPDRLAGKVFIELDPEQFCNQPMVVKLAIQDIQPFSVLVSWQSRNHSGLYGYQIAYYSTDSVEEVRGKMLDQSARSLKLTHLYPGIKYRICVLALGHWISSRRRATAQSRLSYKKASVENITDAPKDGFRVFQENILPILVDSTTSKCTEVLTLGAPDLSVLQDHSTGTQSILTRRLGLIIGCCMGVVVFIVLVSILGYLKIKKQRRALKRDQPTVPPEYMSYRHFSIQSGELIDRSGHPQFMTDINSRTTLN